MIERHQRIVVYILALLLVVVFVSCDKETPTPTESPTSVSPLQSPLTMASPVVEPTPLPEIATPTAMLGRDFDLAQAVLKPEDMVEIFGNTTYGITQPYEREGMWAIQVMYPTKTLEHTTAFAKGFASRVEIYEDFSDLVDAYYALVAEQTGTPFILNTNADEVQAFKETSPYIPDVQDHIILVREANALAVIEIKTSEDVSSETFEQIVNLVVERLQP